MTGALANSATAWAGLRVILFIHVHEKGGKQNKAKQKQNYSKEGAYDLI